MKRFWTVACLTLGLFALASPGGGIEIRADISGFDDLETGVVEAAIEWWEMSIGGNGVFDVTIRKVNLPAGTTGRTTNFMADDGGTPISADVSIDTDGSGSGWFVDETPHEEEEFEPGSNPFAFNAKPGQGADEGRDLLSTVKHELGHALGFSTIYDSFGSNVTDPGGGAPRTYTGNDCLWTLTPRNRGTHFCSNEHPDDLMNTGRPVGRRHLQSADDVKILGDAFGYEVKTEVPSDIAPVFTAAPLASPAAVPSGGPIPREAIVSEIFVGVMAEHSDAETDWSRIFLAEGQVQWMRVVNYIDRRPVTVERGRSERLASGYSALWERLEDLDVWSLEDAGRVQPVEGGALYSFTLRDSSGRSHSFTVDTIEDQPDWRYREVYELIAGFYARLAKGVAAP